MARRELRALAFLLGPRLLFGAALVMVPLRLPAQEVYQAVVLDLTELEIHVTVARARGDEQVGLLLRDTNGQVRLGAGSPISAGLASGGTTILKLALPLLEPGETEFAVLVSRGGTELHRTGWQPLFPGRRFP